MYAKSSSAEWKCMCIKLFKRNYSWCSLSYFDVHVDYSIYYAAVWSSSDTHV